MIHFKEDRADMSRIAVPEAVTSDRESIAQFGKPLISQDIIVAQVSIHLSRK